MTHAADPNMAAFWAVIAVAGFGAFSLAVVFGKILFASHRQSTAGGEL